MTVPSSVAGGNTLVVAAFVGTFRGTAGCSDSRGNSYTVDADTTANGRLFVCSARLAAGLSAGDTITVTYPGFSGLSVAVATEFSGTSGVDQRATANGSNAKPTVGPITTTRARELLVNVVAWGTSPTYSPGCGFIPASEVSVGSGGGRKTVNVSFRTVDATGSYTACGTLSPSGYRWQAALVGHY
jgi:hypothetical protein